MTNDHVDCDCVDCRKNGNSQMGDNLEAIKDDVIRFKNFGSGLDFTRPNGSIRTVYQPKKGRVVDATVVKNLGDKLLLDSGNTFPNDPSKFDIINSKGSIAHQIWRDTQIFTTDNPATNKAVKVVKKTAEVSKNVIHGVEDVVETGANIVSFTGKYLKWIVIILVLAVVAYYGTTLYKATKNG